LKPTPCYWQWPKYNSLPSYQVLKAQTASKCVNYVTFSESFVTYKLNRVNKFALTNMTGMILKNGDKLP
jgi:hypothetical protein